MRKRYIDRRVLADASVKCSNRLIRLDNDLTGYASVIDFAEMEKPLEVRLPEHYRYPVEKLTLADTGYRWIRYLPDRRHWCMTAMYNDRGHIVEWYFDITRQNGVDPNGAPFFDDLYLDIVLMPDGELLTLDQDELEQALENRDISKEDYETAYRVHDRIIDIGIVSLEYALTLCEKLFIGFRDNGISL